MNQKESNTKQNYNIDFERVIELISKYEEKKNSGEIRRYNEESTKKDFILPLFEALGWNVNNRGKRDDSISAEETISKKRPSSNYQNLINHWRWKACCLSAPSV
jgi:hypothetical protein